MIITIKQRLEAGLEAFAMRVCKHRFLVILIVLLATVAAASGLRNIRIDTSNESFLYPNDPVLVRYEAFRDQFGRDDLVIISVKPDVLFSYDSLTHLRDLHEALAEGVPHISNITSLVNIRETRGEGDQLIVEDLLEKWPESEMDFAILRDRVLANPLYRNRLISKDGKVTTIAIELDQYSGQSNISIDDALSFFDETIQPPAVHERLTDEETHQVLMAIQAIVEAHSSDDFFLQYAGTIAVTDSLKLALQDDMRQFIVLVIAIITFLLLIMFRSIAAVFLPLTVVLLALLSTVGLMGHLGTSLKLPTIILPSFLLAVGVGAAVHILEIFKQHQSAGAEKYEAIIGAVGHAGLPILLTSLTTAAGLGSFIFAEVAPIAELGRYAAIGVLIALVYTLTFLPAGLAILPMRKKQSNPARGNVANRLDMVLAELASFGVRRAIPICVGSLCITVASLFLAAQLRFSHDVLSWLPDNWPVRQATQAIDQDLGGSVALEVVVDTLAENGLHDRKTLVNLDRLAREIEVESVGNVTVGSIWSIAELLKEIHQALNENRPEFYRIPDNEQLIPQEFLLFENSGSDDLADLVDARFSVARFSMRVPWLDTLAYVPFIKDVEAKFVDNFRGTANITITGIMNLLSRTLEAAIHSTAQSYVIAFGVITVMMIALIGKFGTGLISMIPNLIPIVLTLALMQLIGIPLNLFTMLVGSIAIGLAVDDTVHFMHHFHRYFARTGNIEHSVRQTILTSGRAMLATSVILSFGFFVFCFASMSNLIHFGLLTGITILTALAADFLLAPALMSLRYRKTIERNKLISGEE